MTRPVLLFAGMGALLVATGLVMGPNYALTVVNMGLVSGILALGVNLQWGFAGLFNVGIMGFVALGALAAVLVGMPPEPDALGRGRPARSPGARPGRGHGRRSHHDPRADAGGRARTLAFLGVAVAGILAARAVLDPAVMAVEAVTPAATGYLGGLGLPVLLAWPAGGLLAAGAAWVIGKTALVCARTTSPSPPSASPRSSSR
jgi:branched-chain amino acid transport system permease protein